ncbi:hypothetical protein L6452_22319 [Arctium lappa]|uniref:Uncharacterized protein n=1 Tax=Arctium lappa TaxID=4217 RepID=A0ACB9AZH6_ARCLA|nr:hypothetical protein L6452_22319 [Arctium lappa]
MVGSGRAMSDINTLTSGHYVVAPFLGPTNTHTYIHTYIHLLLSNPFSPAGCHYFRLEVGANSLICSMWFFLV